MIKHIFADVYLSVVIFSGFENVDFIFFPRGILAFFCFRNIFLYRTISHKIYRKMTVTQEQIQKIAEKLSKVPGGNSSLLWNIQDILKYMELLNEVDTTGVTPTVSVIGKWQSLRKDILGKKITSPEEFLACSNQKVVSGQVILPNIMK